MLRALTAAAATLALGALALSCDYLLQGTYTGLCDEPANLYGDGGPDPAKARMAQCQVQGNLCCRRRDPATGGIDRDHRTHCLRMSECYLGARAGVDLCFSDADCIIGLACKGGNLASGVTGTCTCPPGRMACATPGGASYCCDEATTCGVGNCMPPAAPDMSVPMGPVDLGPPRDLHQKLVDGT